MVPVWVAAGLAALDLGIKGEVERQKQEEFPRELKGSGGRITLQRYHNHGFPFGALKERPELVKLIPLSVASAVAGALGLLMLNRGRRVQKAGLALVLGGAVSNLYDRFTRGYVVDYFTIEWKALKRVIFNLGDLFVFGGGLLFLVGQLLTEHSADHASKRADSKHPDRPFHI